MKKARLLIATLCVGLLLTGCGKIPTLKNGEEVIASIEGKDFSVENLYSEMKKQGGYQVLVNMIDDYIINKEIPDDKEAIAYADNQIEAFKAQVESYGQDYLTTLTSYGFKDESEFKDYYILNYKSNLVMENYLKKNIKDKEVEEYYKDKVFGEMTVRHILIDPKTKSDMTAEEISKAEAEAYKKAEEIITKLKDGKDFADLAKEFSDDKGTASEGGLYSNFVKGDGTVEEFWNASVLLKDGQYTEKPVKTQFGFHIILRVKQNAKPKLKDVKDDILSSIVKDMLTKDSTLKNKTWTDIRKSYKLDIVDSDIKKLYESNNK